MLVWRNNAVKGSKMTKKMADKEGSTQNYGNMSFPVKNEDSKEENSNEEEAGEGGNFTHLYSIFCFLKIRKKFVV